MLLKTKSGLTGYYIVFTATLIFASIFISHQSYNTFTWPISRITLSASPREAAANATLGFQKILALSTRPSWRTRGLQAAAAHTGLQIDIPHHPVIETEVAEAFRRIGEGDSTTAGNPPLGAAMAWLSHLDLLKHVVMSGYETALILEDDVDWDVNLKDQIRMVSDAVRQFTSASPNDPSPYGHDWDVLWLGHCGEHTDPDTEGWEYPDATVLQHANYTGWSQKYMPNIREGHRLVQHGINPVCSFAYAVTAQGAQNVLKWASAGKNEAFDIRLMEACRPRELNVITVQPEIMHHYTPPLEAGYWSEVNAGDGKGAAVNEVNFEHIMGGTENILNSARCKVLFDSTCVKPFRDTR